MNGESHDDVPHHLALAAAFVAAPALADDEGVAPSAPISIDELRATGAGTVSDIAPRGFMLSDADSIWVRTKADNSYLRDGDGPPSRAASTAARCARSR